MISRRSVLKYGLGGTAILSVGGLGVWSRGTRIVAPGAPLSFLTAAEYSVIHAIAGRVIPPRQGFPSVDEVQVAERVDLALAHSHPGLSGDFRQLIRLFENGLTNLIFDGHPTPFTAMSPEAQDAALESWKSSKISIRRTAYTALKGIVVASYYSNPITYPAINYPGPPEISELPPTEAIAASLHLGGS